jgi:putative IMPACT (imprinted ancient) family translation regulator
MLEVLRRRQITDTVAVVTRYFGGTMLGAGGLIRAYGGSVSNSIEAIGVMERKRLSVQTLVAPYDDAGRIENTIRSSEYPLSDVAYGDSVTFELVMEPEQVQSFRHSLVKITNGAIVPMDAGERIVKVPAPAEAPTQPQSR